MATNPKSTTYSEYLTCRDKAGRLAHLARLRDSQSYLPISLAEDVLCLDLSSDEKLAVLEATGSRDGRAFEHFLTTGLELWPQDLAATAVRLWSQRTDHLLWFRVLETCKSPHVAQRVFYTILDHAFRTGGRHVIRAAVQAEGLEDMSPAFHGLVLHRAVQWNETDSRLEKLANRIAGELTRHLHPENKALPSSVAYLARFHPETLAQLATEKSLGEPWRDQLRAVVTQLDQRTEQTQRLLKLVGKPTKAKPGDKQRAQLSAAWLPVWARHALDAGEVAQLLASSAAAFHSNDTMGGPDFFSGIPESSLTEALAKIDDADVFTMAIVATFGFLTLPASTQLLDIVKARVAAAADPAGMLTRLPLRLRLELTDSGQEARGGKPTVFALVKQEETTSLKGTPAKRVAFVEEQGDGSHGETPSTVAARKRFFNVAYRGNGATTTSTPPKDAGKNDPDQFWDFMLDAWNAPSEAKLTPMAQAARRDEGLFRLCYVNTLGRFKGHDQAALKLLDFIRSKEEDDVRAIIHALGGIGTPRAGMELVAILTRPNVTPALQLEACAILAKQDLTNLQSELRSAIKDLTVTDGSESLAEVRDAITSLITPSGAPSAVKSQSVKGGVSDQQLDQALMGKIQHYKDLSSEVKRALRTSQFFHIQVTSDSAPESIDLSPVIDMQYKALELLFRETFEEACSQLINRGVLQRRLDVIGYARPIPRSMDEFEAYVAALPVIRDIPFFSKFKLRKMLRAICQFRPGKRFTLDGLKAFALFFLCFGRLECRYGLAGLFPLGFATDRDLYDFCKALHVLQDFRNRAAHEGFHPDASNDIDGIWRQTAEIVQTMFKAKHYVEDASSQEFAPKNRSTPVIEKKVS